jgi:hypothetical protein
MPQAQDLSTKELIIDGERPAAGLGFRAIVVLSLIGSGVYWWIFFGWWSIGRGQIIGLIGAGVAAFLPSVSRWVDEVVRWCNRLLQPRLLQTSIFVGAIVFAYLLCFAWASHDRLFLTLNDEHAYMIQGRLLARGRLWMPAYPAKVAPFFDALAMIVDRVYAPMYFPGTALALAPFCKLGLHYWFMTVLADAVAAGFLYAVVAELFDPFRGLLGVLILLSLHVYRGSAILLLSEAPFLAAELILIWGWLRFYRRPSILAACVIGGAGGYAAITRPLDAVCFALPIAVAIVWQMRRTPLELARWGGLMVVSAAPLVLLLLVQNVGVTGHLWESAEGYFNRENFPASPMGFHAVGADQIPAGMNPVKVQWLRDWVLPSFERHTFRNAVTSWYRGRLLEILKNSLGNPILVLLIPLGLLGVRGIKRVVLVVPLVLFCVGYGIYLFTLEHYVGAILPSMICLIFMGAETLGVACAGRWVRTFVTLSLLALSISVLWPVVPVPELPVPWAPDQRVADELLAMLPRTPAVVLFRFDPAVGSFHDDPVYNDGVAFPDDGEVVRARDLGAEKDRELIRYYAEREPDRVFYIYDPDRRAGGLDPLSSQLGTAKDLESGKASMWSE